MAATRGRMGRARITDLLIWDAVLVAAVAGLYAADRGLDRPEAALGPAGPAAPGASGPVVVVPPPAPPTRRVPARVVRVDAAPDEGTGPGAAAPVPPPTPTPATQPVAPPQPSPGDAEARARAALARCQDEARGHARAGRPEEALAVWTRAGAVHGGTAVWRDAGAAAEAAARAELLAWAGLRALLPACQLAADRRDADAARALEGLVAALALEPLERAPLEAELARARGGGGGGAGGAGGGGLVIRGFRPDAVALDGRLARVQGGVERSALEGVRDAVDAALALADTALGPSGGARPTVHVLAPDDEPPAGGPWTRARPGEDPADLADRARLLVATWRATPRLGRDAPGWVAHGLPLALAGLELRAGGPAAPNRLGRALAALARLRGDRAAERPAQALATARPAPWSAFALAWLGLGRPPGAAAPLGRALRGALEGTPAPLAPADVEALEAAWPDVVPAPDRGPQEDR